MTPAIGPVLSPGPSRAVIRDHGQLLSEIVSAYDSPIIQAYSRVRFQIININILHILGLCLRDKRRVLDIGCGFGLFGCYFSSLYPEIVYRGIDLNSRRISRAQRAADRLGLVNATFSVADARELTVDDEFDAIMMIDLLHHVDDRVKHRLLLMSAEHLAEDGRLVIKDVNTRPAHALAFTWALDVLMTRGFDMWYWDEPHFRTVLTGLFSRLDTYPIRDWLPYPHVVYLSEGPCVSDEYRLSAAVKK